MDFDPSLLHEVNGETLINPTATAGKHQAAVKAHLDELIGVWKDMEENRNSVQDKMMERYDKNYRELKGMKKGQLVMVEAKHISVPAKRVKGVMDSEKLAPRPRGLAPQWQLGAVCGGFRSYLAETATNGCAR